ncbi:hypothetical protein BGC07_14695 [Piscirickettsia litoralis]|uniref:Major facilitator superfamily (MFS) profile domain-containing protein n=1 Tax=Piscirickettsia litoralis TaxID=1891921 RepID=A0ABX3A5T2_9GAMM|nr:hypothetical protein BGC07_14695 [Piscirickettsia litoralis]
MAWWALSQINSAAVFASLIAYASFFEVFSRIIFSSLGDQIDRKLIIIICNSVSAATALALIILSIAGIFDFYLLVFLIVISSIATGVRSPLESSILPMLVKTEQVSEAFRFNKAVYSVVTLIGPGFAGLLISLYNVQLAFIIDFIFIIVACIFVLLIKSNTHPIKNSNLNNDINKGSKIFIKDWYHKTIYGIRALFYVKPEFYFAILAMLINFALYPFFMILVPVFIKNHLGLGAWSVGLVDAGFGVGILLASLFLVKKLSDFFYRDIIIFIGTLLLGASLLLSSLLVNPYIIAIVMVIGGAGLMLININTTVLRSLATPEHYRNRMMAIVSAFSSLSLPLGSYFAGLLLSAVGITYTMEIFGAIIFIVSFFILILPSLKQVSRLPECDLKGVYYQIYPKAFKDQL